MFFYFDRPGPHAVAGGAQGFQAVFHRRVIRRFLRRLFQAIPAPGQGSFLWNAGDGFFCGRLLLNLFFRDGIAHSLKNRVELGGIGLVGYHVQHGAAVAFLSRDKIQQAEGTGQLYRDRAFNKMSKSVEAMEKAEYYDRKAEAAENNTAISSDDPEAITKLNDKLSRLKDRQSFMKNVNAYYRKHQTCRGCEGLTSEQAAKMDNDMANAYSWETAPFPAWALSNNNAEIRRLEKRIVQLEQNREVGFVGWEFDGGRVVANADDNRLQVFFDEIPPEDVRSALKSNGFHWARSAGAWQRQLTGNAICAASRIKAICPSDGTDPRKIQPRAKPNKGQER